MNQYNIGGPRYVSLPPIGRMAVPLRAVSLTVNAGLAAEPAHAVVAHWAGAAVPAVRNAVRGQLSDTTAPLAEKD